MSDNIFAEYDGPKGTDAVGPMPDIAGITAMYGPDFYAQHLTARDEYRAMADALFHLLCLKHGDSVRDFGCGPGEALERFQELGCQVWGEEGSIHARNAALASIRERITLVDLRLPVRTYGPQFESIYDRLVICTETAEHLPAYSAEILVDSLVAASSKFICFSAAVPGQGGHGHVNCQPVDYWLKLFLASQEGRVELDAHLTYSLRNLLATGMPTQMYYSQNTMLLQVTR